MSETSSQDTPPLLQMRGIVKQYPGVRALDGVDFELRAGEVHVLFGENGAGKSTMISIIAGANAPTAGTMEVNGREVSPQSVHDARELGISAVFQEFSLIPQMTVEQNLFLGDEFVKYGMLDTARLHREAEKLLDEFGFDVKPNQIVGRLTRAAQQMVEIAKAFRSEISILILDEPTASLNQKESDQLFRLVETLKERGVGIVYITHRMAEIREIGDRVTVLRDGRYITTVPVETTSEDELVQLMTGRVVGEIFPEIDHKPGETILETEELTTADAAVRDASISARAGEIIGLAGLVGSGKSIFGQACFGAYRVGDGTVRFKGEDVTGFSSKKMLKRGFLYLPSDRRHEGLMMMRPARENISLPALSVKPFSNGFFLNSGEERKVASNLAERLNLSPMRPENTPDSFSGGNQQKIMLARSLTQDFDLIIFDEPTVGVDVGTRAAIYRFIKALAENGAAVIVISSDLPEILHLCNRAYVFYRGVVQAELQGDEITEEGVLSHFFEKEAA
ncbi:MAG: sugar ABC transporter ATP-binding protein [Pseudomonadota bacterium]